MNKFFNIIKYHLLLECLSHKCNKCFLMAFILIGIKKDALCDWLNVSKSHLRGWLPLYVPPVSVSVSVHPLSSSLTSPVLPPFSSSALSFSSPSSPSPPLPPPCPLLHPPPPLSSSVTSARLTVAQTAFQVPISTNLLPSVNHSASRDSCISHEWRSLVT